jgi:hypothetical protein
LGVGIDDDRQQEKKNGAKKFGIHLEHQKRQRAPRRVQSENNGIFFKGIP